MRNLPGQYHHGRAGCFDDCGLLHQRNKPVVQLPEDSQHFPIWKQCCRVCCELRLCVVRLLNSIHAFILFRTDITLKRSMPSRRKSVLSCASTMLVVCPLTQECPDYGRPVTAFCHTTTVEQHRQQISSQCRSSTTTKSSRAVSLIFPYSFLFVYVSC